MTYNLRFASDAPPHSWPERRRIMRDLLRRERPDVLGTQEGRFEQLKDLTRDLPGYAWIGLGREGGSDGEFMAVFYRSGRLEPLEYDHFWLSDTPESIGSKSWGNRLPRMATWVKFRDRRTERVFYFFNTHLDHESKKARHAAASLIATCIDRFHISLPVFLVGDFNDDAGRSETYDIFTQKHAFKDAWETASHRGADICTVHNYLGPMQNGPRIDWILYRGNVKVCAIEILTYEEDGFYPSDHFPVRAFIELGEANATKG